MAAPLALAASVVLMIAAAPAAIAGPVSTLGSVRAATIDTCPGPSTAPTGATVGATAVSCGYANFSTVTPGVSYYAPMTITNTSLQIVIVSGIQGNDPHAAMTGRCTGGGSTGVQVPPGRSCTLAAAVTVPSSSPPPPGTLKVAFTVKWSYAGGNTISTAGAETINVRAALAPTAGPSCTNPISQGGVVGMATTKSGNGYWVVNRAGQIATCGDAASYPVVGGAGAPVSPAVAIAATPDSKGYWIVDANGTVVAFGDAHNYGGSTHLNAPIVGMAADPATGGYWLVAKDGGVFSFHAPFYGSTGNLHLNQPVVGMTATANGRGYLFVAADGGVFTYGDTAFHGSVPAVLKAGQTLNKPVVGVALDNATGGYWMAAADGGIFSFAAPFYGSAGNLHLNASCVSMNAMPAGNGYRFVATDGGIFDFGAAPFEGSAA